MMFVGENYLRSLLQKKATECGSIRALAEWMGIDQGYLSHLLRGDVPISPRVADWLRPGMTHITWLDRAGDAVIEED